MKKHNIIFLPDWSEGNPYQNLLKKGLEENNCIVSFDDFQKGYFKLCRSILRNPRIQTVHLHWINNYISNIVWSNGKITVRVKLFLMALDIILARLKVNVVWTVHNLISHESNNQNSELLSRKLLAKLCNQIIVHSEGAKNRVIETYDVKNTDKMNIVEHGHYIGCYPATKSRNDLREEMNFTNKNTVFLFFGKIRGYKGIDYLIDEFKAIKKPLYRLLIVGKPIDEKAKKSIQDKIKNDSRITSKLGFIPENQVGNIFKLCDCVVIPFERTLTSGSVVLAMSECRALILPEEAKSLDIVNTSGVIFYKKEDVKQALLNASKYDLPAMGECNYKLAKNLDWIKIGEKLSRIYTHK